MSQQVTAAVTAADEDIAVQDEIAAVKEYEASSTLDQSSISSNQQQSHATKAATLFFIIPFLSVLRDGLESVLLFAGVGISAPPTSIPLAAISGLLLGMFFGFLLHKLQRTLSLRAFFLASSYLLLLMSAGFLVKGVYELEEYTYKRSLPSAEAVEDEEMPVPINRSNLIWYLPSTDPKENIGFGVLNSLLGFQSIATVATITSYCLYWVSVVGALAVMKLKKMQRVRMQSTALDLQNVQNVQDAAVKQEDERPSIVMV